LTAKVLHLLHVPAQPSGARPATQPSIDPAIVLEEGLASAALALGDLPAVIRHCSKLVQLAPGHFPAWFNLGYARLQAGDSEQSEFAFHQAHKLRPDLIDPLLNLALLKHEPDPDAAIEAYQAVLTIDPACQIALWNLALLASNCGQQELALDSITRLSELAPDDASVWFQRGAILAKSSNWEDAMHAFDQAAGLRPEWEDARFNTAFCALESGHPASLALEALALTDPDSPALHHLSIQIALKQGDLDAAIQARSKLAQSRSCRPATTFNLALACHRAARFHDAMILYCEAINAEPTLAPAMLNLGHVLDKLGQFDRARQCWDRAIEMNPALAAGYFNG
jgi:tetratricopeptide (TPR) repeat protein